jgi:PAS domain S-box-containing protein
MTQKSSYEELEQRVEELEREVDERRCREEVLRESEEKWRSMLESVPNFIAVADRKGAVQYVNRAAPEMSVVDDPQHPFISKHAVEEAFQFGRIGSYPIRGIDAESNTSWYEINFGPIKCCEKVVAAMFLATDITERERAVRVRDRAIESSINGIAFADLQGNLTYVNDSFLKMWGYENSEEVVGRPAVEFWERQEDSWKVIEALRGRGNWMGGLVAKKINGSLFDVHLSASMITDEDGKHAVMMGSFIDITEYKQAEAALKDSEQRYRLLVETMNDGLGVQDENGSLTYVNDRICEILGYSRDEVIGRPITQTNF